MSKIFLISNTSFGYKNNNLEWLEIMKNYFQYYFIPFIKKHSKSGDFLLHMGNLFYQTNINIDTLNITQDVIEEISKIIPVKLVVGLKDKIDNNSINSHKIFKGIKNIDIISNIYQDKDIAIIPHIKNFYKEIKNIEQKNLFIHHDLNTTWSNNNIFNGFHLDNNKTKDFISIGAPYQLKKEDSDKKRGFVVVKTENFQNTFVENTYSPKFNTIKIKNIDEIEKLDSTYIDKNFIDVEIPKELININENKIKVMLSKYNLQEIHYLDQVVEDEFEKFEDTDIKTMIENFLNKEENSSELLEEFENIVKSVPDKD